MTGDRNDQRDALDRLTNALVDDIFNSSDEDILAEASENGGDPEQIAEDVRALFERTILEQAKARLHAAKAAVAESRRQTGRVVKINPTEARRRYEAKIADDPELSAKLTLAARKGKGQSERDIDSAIEDLDELGAFDEEDDAT